MSINYFTVQEFCTKHRLDYNEVCVMVRAALAWDNVLRERHP